MSDHGTNSRYTQGCRCRECKAAHAEVMLRYLLYGPASVRLRALELENENLRLEVKRLKREHWQ